MRAVAEHDVQQDDRRGRVARLLDDAAVAQARIDHRVQPALGELVLAQVDADVAAAHVAVGHLVGLDQRRVAVYRLGQVLQDELRLVAEGAAGEQPAQSVLAGRPASPARPQPGRSGPRSLPPAAPARRTSWRRSRRGGRSGDSGGERGRLRQVGRRDRARGLDGPRLGAEEADDGGLGPIRAPN